MEEKNYLKINFISSPTPTNINEFNYGYKDKLKSVSAFLHLADHFAILTFKMQSPCILI